MVVKTIHVALLGSRLLSRFASRTHQCVSTVDDAPLAALAKWTRLENCGAHTVTKPVGESKNQQRASWNFAGGRRERLTAY